MTMDYRAKLRESLRAHEGLRLNSYQDSRGVWTIGYGTNLQTLRITPALADAWLEDALSTVERRCAGYLWFSELTPARQNVVREMLYNLGPAGLGQFVRFQAALQDKRWKDAADEMRKSRWAAQVGKRAEDLATLMERGEYDA